MVHVHAVARWHAALVALFLLPAALAWGADRVDALVAPIVGRLGDPTVAALLVLTPFIVVAAVALAAFVIGLKRVAEAIFA